ncbi:nucleoside-diphosphate-sugar epimerase [Rhodococcus sp. BE178]
MDTDRALRVVVIGATGNVGTSVVEALSAAGHIGEIVGAARRPTELAYPKTRFVVADTTTDDIRGLVRGADVVIHLAWLFQPTHRPEVTWNNNVLGAIRVFEAVADERVPALVYVSSVAAYSPDPSDRAVAEDWPTHGWPGAAYPMEKAYLERWLDAEELRHPETRVVRIRPCFLFKRRSATEQR